MNKLTSVDWWMGRTPDQQERKQQARKDWEDAKSRLATTAKKTDLASRLNRWGWTLTIVVTIPLLGLVFGGLIGLVIGVVIAAIFLASRRTGDQ